MSDNILAARDLRKAYTLGKHRVDVLKGINLEVKRAEAVVITGPSGAGKSTLLHLLGGLDEPSSGEVTLGGQSVFSLSGTQRTRLRNEQLGFVFQSYNLLPELDALENVCVPALVAGRRGNDVIQRGRELLEAVGLGGRLEHRPAELSGGEQQRVAVARALMNRPALLLADEPTGNLDARTGEAILDVLWRLREESGTTLVMVTHDQHVATRGERVLEIADGVIR
ncbi:MAG TPA: ABC transporter ATP-binding protein [Verrucomicrobiae bacterium]|nr:ABC transporter ATP-binding protein [Verrucomicrobiae bacterium]